LDIVEQTPPLGLPKCTFEYVLGYGLKTGIVLDIYLVIVDRRVKISIYKKNDMVYKL
jgi:hypothetical protein